MRETNSDAIWNIVGALVAVLLISFIVFTGFELFQRPQIPITGGGSQPSSAPELLGNNPSSGDNSPDSSDANPEVNLPVSSDPDVPELIDNPSPQILLPAVWIGYGPEGQFLLHRIKAGESYGTLSELYQTNFETLDALNHNTQGKLLWAGQYIVIIPGLTNPIEDMPKFFVLEIKEFSSLVELAQENQISVGHLLYYNNLAEGGDFIEPRLLMIPYYE